MKDTELTSHARGEDAAQLLLPKLAPGSMLTIMVKAMTGCTTTSPQQDIPKAQVGTARTRLCMPRTILAQAMLSCQLPSGGSAASTVPYETVLCNLFSVASSVNELDGLWCHWKQGLRGVLSPLLWLALATVTIAAATKAGHGMSTPSVSST